MEFTHTTRKVLYDSFRESNRPSKMFGFWHGATELAAIDVFTNKIHELSDIQKEAYNKICIGMDSRNYSPGKYFKTHYSKTVEFLAGSKENAAILLKYFDKLNQFPYTIGYNRRTIRTSTYIEPVRTIHAILHTSYMMQIYKCPLDKFLLNQMSEEFIDFKKCIYAGLEGLSHIIAARLDAGDKALKDAIIRIITGENNVAFITTDIIRGIFYSSDKELHSLLGELLIAARLQEGLRQAICENMDCGTIDGFREIFHVIAKNDLLRFSAVRRAVATWIGMIDPENLKRSSDKTFSLMKEVVDDRSKAFAMLDTNDAVSILVGLWGLGFYEVNDAVSAMEKIAATGSRVQKLVASYYNINIQDSKIQQKFAAKILEAPDFDIELAAGIFTTYMTNVQSEVYKASGENYLKPSKPRPIDLSLWFTDKNAVITHYRILNNLLLTMSKKKYVYAPFIFPWYQADVSRSDVLLRMMAIANGLNDEKAMDELADCLSQLDGTDGSRLSGVRMLLYGNLSKHRREVLIDMLGDRETLTMHAAFKIADKTKFEADEYDKMCGLLRFKSSEIRRNTLSLLKKQDKAGLQRSIKLLLSNKKEEMHLGGLELLCDNPSEEGNKLAASIENPTEREKIFLEKIFPEKISSTNGINEKSASDELFTAADTIPVHKIAFSKADYPIFRYDESQIKSIYNKLNALIDEHSNTEIKTAYGETVLLGNLIYSLPPLNYGDDIEKKYPLMEMWKDFYEKEIGDPKLLMALLIASDCYLQPRYYSRYSPGRSIELSKESSMLLYHHCCEAFGEAVTAFDSTGLARKNLILSIFRILKDIYCSEELQFEITMKTLSYVCNQSCTAQKQQINLFLSPIFYRGTAGLLLPIAYGSRFEDKFNIVLELQNSLKQIPQEYELKAVDYVIAAYRSIITKKQMYKGLLESENLRSIMQNLFLIYRAEKYPAFKKTLTIYGIDGNEPLENFLRDTAATIADKIVSVECKRGEATTPYSNSVCAIEFFYGIEHLAALLTALGKEKLSRTDGYFSYSEGGRKNNLSHLISVCHPHPEDTSEDFRKVFEKNKISDKRLIEIAMYAPQWIDMIEDYLKIDGLKSGAYYFMAHTSEHFALNSQKFSTIAKFTPLEKEELTEGAFDINWFEKAYSQLGENNFKLLYDAAKYISDGNRHTRARKYADAALGKVEPAALELEITEKRNKDTLMSYPLIPLSDSEDILHRYQFIQNFRKESRQFGAQRRASEGKACDMALRNLATRAGYKDVTRLTLVMEKSLAESLSSYCDWHNLTNEKASIDVRIEISSSGKPEISIRKAGKSLALIPAAFKKDPYISSLKEAHKTFRDQYSRTVNMFEASMEEREEYTLKEICNLRSNPVLLPVVENMVYITSNEQTFTFSPATCADGALDEGTATCTCQSSNDNKPILITSDGEVLSIEPTENIRIAHAFDLFNTKKWSDWQKFFFERQQQTGAKQPFRQVFRELYVKLDEELEQMESRLFAGHQIMPLKTIAALKSRKWIADYETGGLEKIFYKDNIAVTMYALADWFSPSDIEAPTLEFVTFYDTKSNKQLRIEEVPDIVYSEAMRDVDLAVSIAHAGAVDPQASHSTIEMRAVIAECNIKLFGLDNVRIEKSHALISGSLGEYTVHLGSGVVHMRGIHQLNVLPVHSQHRGKIFLPFIDDDPKTAEIISKILLFAEDKKIKDPYILSQMQR